MPCGDVTAGHYYGQLMPTAHTSCHRPAPAWFTEHGQHAGEQLMLENHGHCPANDNVKVGLNKVSFR